MDVSKFLIFICLAVCYKAVQCQKYCCMPNQFEIKCGASGAMSSDRRGMAIIGAYMPRMSMDFSGKKFSIKEMAVKDGRVDNVTTIMDYNSHTIFMIKWSSRTCRKAPLPGSISGQCIPKDAKWMGTTTVGGGKGGSITCDSYGLSRISKDPPYKMEVFLNVQDPGCIPVNENIIGSWGRTTFQTGIGYMDFSEGIKDASVFDPPSFCAKAPLMTDDDLSEVTQALLLKFTE